MLQQKIKLKRVFLYFFGKFYFLWAPEPGFVPTRCLLSLFFFFFDIPLLPPPLALMTGFLPPDRYVGNPVFLVSPFFLPSPWQNSFAWLTRIRTKKMKRKKNLFLTSVWGEKLWTTKLKKDPRQKKTFVYRTKMFWTLFSANQLVCFFLFAWISSAPSFFAFLWRKNSFRFC